MPEALLSIRDLVVEYPTAGPKPLRAVERLSLDVAAGEIVALVGESGCGKTTVGQAIVGLTPIRSGEIRVAGRPRPKSPAEWKLLRREVAFIFQDPYASLDPLWRAEAVIAEPLRVHGLASGAELGRRAHELAEMAGFESALLSRRPYELSGGQRQRVAIARALATEPKLVIADEPTAALDVSIRAQVLNLLRDLQQKLGLSLLFISHDLATVRYIADRVAVMYAGAVAETGPTAEVLSAPLHPYSAALARSLPEVGRFGVLPPVLEGEVPNPLALPSGCRFRTRCPIARERCVDDEPELVPRNGSQVACHFPLVAP